VILDNSGTEIDGFINYKNWINSPDVIQFKESLTDKSVTSYLPLEIEYVKVADEKYISAIVNKETTPRTIGSFDFDQELHLTKDTVFLQVLIEGSKSLYHLSERTGIKNYYLDNKGKTELLGYKKYYKKIETKKKVFEVRQFRNQLVAAFYGCDDVVERAKKVEYKRSQLISLFLNYYKCSSDEILFVKKIKKAVNKFGVFGGLSLAKLSFKGIPSFDDLTTADFPMTAGYSIGAYHEVIFPRVENRLSLKTNLHLFSYSTNFNTDKITAPGFSEESDISFSYKYLKLGSQLKYKVFKGVFDVFMTGGFSAGLELSSENVQEISIVSNNISNIREKPAISKTRIIEMTWFAGFGISKGRYALEFLYEKGPAMSNFFDLKSSLFRIHILGNYAF